MSRHSERGQTLPVWTFGTLTLLVMAAMMLAYGTNLRYQIEAQNAADAAAQGMLSIQTSQLNQTTAALHSATVEEYRIRYILNDLEQVSQGNGGCNPHSDFHDKKSCWAMYLNLR
ncbi:MAG: hypothetical protein JO165_06560, partial [Candidatus Eremiobacteraeota bacterium]|nr:hypothetical protein [Candidatus Eremiobacteraeota bacterium]